MLSFNVEGFKRKQSYKILFLQEIWLPLHEEKLINDFFPDHTFKISTPDMFIRNEDKLQEPSHVRHGVAIGWHKDINSKITVLESFHERIAGIKLKLPSKYLILISFYAPTAGHDEDFLESIAYLRVH